MDAPQTLRRPANWQDFESLCKKLWGEIWVCPEIAKNGRAGQKQNGVDVFGVPKGESKYYGIQCKGREEYTDRQFTKEEIEAEIENAKQFKPALKKLYLATTAVKDAKIEEYVREKNIRNIENGFFEVHLYSWEDIVDLIDENKQTHDWYVANNKYKLNQGIDVTFSDGTKKLTLIAKFKKEYIEYRPKIVSDNSYVVGDPLLVSLFNKEETAKIKLITRSLFNKKITNFSFVGFSILLTNTGTVPLENYKLKLDFQGKIQQLAYDNVEKKRFCF